MPYHLACVNIDLSCHLPLSLLQSAAEAETLRDGLSGMAAALEAEEAQVASLSE